MQTQVADSGRERHGRPLQDIAHRAIDWQPLITERTQVRVAQGAAASVTPDPVSALDYLSGPGSTLLSRIKSQRSRANEKSVT